MAGAGRKPNINPPAGPDPEDRAYAAMLARARALIPSLSDRAARTEELRRLPPETERDLHESGLFRIVQPKRVGGSEFDYVALVDCADAEGAGRIIHSNPANAGHTFGLPRNITASVMTALQ